MKEENGYRPQWLEDDRTPFCVPVFDCRCRALSTEEDHEHDIGQGIFTRPLIKGDDYYGKLPPNPVKFKLDFSFALDDSLPSGEVLFRPNSPSERWYIFRRGELLYFVCDGEIYYLAHIKECSHELTIDLMILSRNRIDNRDPFWHARAMYFLIRSHLLDQVVPHPLPNFLPDQEERILKFSFDHFGSKGLFGAFRFK